MTEEKIIVRFKIGENLSDEKYYISKNSEVDEIKDIFIETFSGAVNFDKENIYLYHNSVLLNKTLKEVEGVTELELVLDVVFDSPIIAAPSGRISGCLVGHSEAVLTCSFSSCGQLLASGGGDGYVRFWDINTKTPLSNIKCHNHWVQTVSWSPDGTCLASGSMCGEIIIINLPDFRTSKVIVNTTSPVTCISWAKGKGTSRVAFGFMNGKIGICDDIKNTQIVKSLSGHEKAVTSLNFHSNGNLYSTSRDCFLKIWNRDGSLMYKTKPHSHWINDLTLNSRSIFSCSEDSTIVMTDLVDVNRAIKMTGHQGPVTQISLSPNGKFVASCSFDKCVKIWDSQTGSFIKNLRGHSSSVYRICWCANSKYLASVGKDSTLKIWDISTGKLFRELSGHRDEIYCIDWSKKGELATGGKDRTLRIWD
jgi:ribosome assembly protein 4